MPESAAPPSREHPLTGGCLCGGVRFEITGPFLSASYCHCTRCQRRTGTASSSQGRVAQDDFRLVQGEDLLRAWVPPAPGKPKLFCSNCGAHLFSGDPLSDDEVSVRLGVLDRDPGIRPQYRTYVDSAVAWEPIPDDGLERFAGPRA